MGEGRFATTINCMDGRTQIPVIEWMKKKYGADYVDSVTEPGPIKLLAEGDDPARLDSIKRRVMISTEKHGSRAIAIVGHHDCAGNPCDCETQIGQIKKAIALVKSWNTGAEVVGVYVDEKWQVSEVG